MLLLRGVMVTRLVSSTMMGSYMDPCTRICDMVPGACAATGSVCWEEGQICLGLYWAMPIDTNESKGDDVAGCPFSHDGAVGLPAVTCSEAVQWFGVIEEPIDDDYELAQAIAMSLGIDSHTNEAIDEWEYLLQDTEFLMQYFPFSSGRRGVISPGGSGSLASLIQALGYSTVFRAAIQTELLPFVKNDHSLAIFLRVIDTELMSSQSYIPIDMRSFPEYHGADALSPASLYESIVAKVNMVAPSVTRRLFMIGSTPIVEAYCQGIHSHSLEGCLRSASFEEQATLGPEILFIHLNKPKDDHIVNCPEALDLREVNDGMIGIYRLISLITRHGNQYTTRFMDPADGQWIHANNDIVQAVDGTTTLACQSPYAVVYERISIGV